MQIFTLANYMYFLRWTYFGPKRLSNDSRWTPFVHATLRIIDGTDKWNSWLADVTFNRRHVMVTAVGPNNQTSRFIYNFSSPLILQDFHQNFTNNEHKWCKKQSINIRDELHFFCRSSKYERSGSRAKLTWCPSDVTYFAWVPLYSYWMNNRKMNFIF